jgi:hypothetical protein
MPFIRDFATAYEAVTSDAGITVPICDVVQNDLLLAFGMADTFVGGSWSCSGFSQLFARIATVGICCFWKIAGASEADVAIVGTVTETYNGIIVAIGDVDTAYPFGNPAQYVETTGSGTRVAMPQVTAQRANSLVIFHAASAGNNAGIHFVEGLLHALAISDGAAEGMGLGWMLQKTAAQCPVVYATSPVSTVTKAAILINPPSGGALVVPAYCVNDGSVLLDHNASATAFDSNTAMAATADTNFGTSIAGKTGNDATVAIAADIGINSFHGMQGLTNAVTAGQMSGANIVLAASRYNIGARNVLAHFRHPTPANNQRLSTTKSGRGLWMGLRSGTTAGQNWKVWQVHGADVPIIAGNVQPLVVNCGNADQIAVNGTLVDSDVRYVGFWAGGQGILQQQACIGPMWAMDTLVMAGGQVDLPIGIPEIVAIAAMAKERLSSVLQGAKQMLCLQTIQFGDGGTNPVYLNLDATAIEFPTRRSLADKIVNYNGIDDSVGLIYYPGAGETIIHKNSVISAANKFRWGLHASASLSAIYDFSGTAVIGAGTIALARAIAITGLTINGYATLDMTGLTFVSGAIKSVPAGNDLATLANAALTTCAIDVRGVTAGNRWCSVASPAIFTGCTFTGSGSTGHAIRITSPGTYAMVGNIFTGFGADGSNFAAIFNDSGGLVTLNISGGGGTPTIRNGSGASTVVNNSKTLTITGLINGSEVRIYTHGTTTELSGVESSGTSHAYAYNYAAGAYVDIVVLALGYLYLRIDNYLLTNGDASLPVQQQKDRQYSNP